MFGKFIMLYTSVNIFQKIKTTLHVKKIIDDNLTELGRSLLDTPCTTNKKSIIVAATSTMTHIDCSCHRLNTSMDTAWKSFY